MYVHVNMHISYIYRHTDISIAIDLLLQNNIKNYYDTQLLAAGTWGDADRMV